MTDAELLEKVKKALGITGNYQDDTITVYMEEVIDFLLNAGVSENVIRKSASVGIISRGVSDLWNYGTGGGDLSPYFYRRAAQLCYKGGETM